MTNKSQSKPNSKLSRVTAAFIEYESFLKRFLMRFLSRPQDIEDIVQETYIKARCAEKKTDSHLTKSLLVSYCTKRSVEGAEKEVPSHYRLY